MNYFSLSGSLIAITSAAMGIFVFVKKPKNKINRLWSIFTLCVAFWGFGAYKIGVTNNPTLALFWWRTAHIGIILIPVLFIHFVYTFLTKKEKWPIIAGYIFGVGFLIINASGHLIKNVEWTFDSFYYDGRPPTLLYVVFAFLWFFAISGCHYKLYVGIRNVSGIKKNQIKYFLLATAIGFSGGLTCFLPVFGIDIYPYGNFTVPLYPLIMSYAIVKYRLMDIRIFASHTLIFLFVYIPILLIPFGLYSKGLIGANLAIFLEAILAPAGLFVYLRLQSKAEKRLFQEEYLCRNLIRRVSNRIVHIRDFKKGCSYLTEEMFKGMNVEHVSIYVLDKIQEKYALKAHKGSNGELTFLSADLSLVAYLMDNGKMILLEEAGQFKDDFSDIIKQLKAVVIMPIIGEENLIGILVLGAKKDGRMYSTLEIESLEDLSGQAALMIETVMSFEEKEQLQIELMQARANKQLADMAYGISHQFNNRFNGISTPVGTAKMMLEMIDQGKLEDNEKKALETAIEYIDAAEDSAMRGGDIAQGVLRISRPEREGFEMLDVPEILDDALELISYKHSNFDVLKITKSIEDDLPQTWASKAYLQDIFFIVLDNSYDAIDTRVRFNEEEEFSGNIDVGITNNGQGAIVITVKDDGIGMKPNVLEKVRNATPYVSTKASSVKSGFGAGVYMLHKFIEALRGSIRYESEYGSGCEITISVPITSESKSGEEGGEGEKDE